jgi:hypothetical protein
LTPIAFQILEKNGTSLAKLAFLALKRYVKILLFFHRLDVSLHTKTAVRRSIRNRPIAPILLMASRDINLNNKDNIPNRLIPAFSDFHHPIRSVKAKLFPFTSIFDKDNTTKL